MLKRRTTVFIASSSAFAVCAVALMTLWISEQSSAPATAQSSAEKRWLAVAPGRIEAQSGQIKIATPVVGIVDAVLVKVNDTVFAGEPLIRLKDSELQARLLAAEAQVAVRKRSRNEQGATGRAEDRRKAEDFVAEGEQAVIEAQEAVDRAAAQFRATGNPNAALTTGRTELARAVDDLGKRKILHRRVENGAPLPTSQEAQLIAARAELSIARAALDKMTIRAPIDGTVLQLNIKPGEMAAPSMLQPLAVVANISTLRVRAELDERDLTEVKVGQAASVRASAFPDREFPGRVASIAPLVEPARISARGADNRTDVDAVEVLVDLTQPGPLAVGMRVDVYFERAAPSQ
jgi:HlyD family secretion protein